MTTARNILVTGGAGFIGSHLIRLLQQRGDHLTIVDDLSTGRPENLAGVDCRFIEARLTAALPELEPDAFDQIYHLAAAVGVRLVIERPVHTIETNIHETSALLDFALRAKAPTLIASTSEVYGKAEKTPFSEDDDVVYGPTTLSRWSYACSKAIDEYLALAHHRDHSLPVVVMRFFNTVGPRQVGTYGMVLPRFVEAALGGHTLQVHGDGRQSRCFCDVRDVIRALPAVLDTTTCHGRVLNIGNDEVISILDLASLVVETLGSNSDIQLVPYDQAFGEGFDDLRTRRPDLSRIQKAIGFSAQIPLVQTIRDIAAEMMSDDNTLTGATS